MGRGYKIKKMFWTKQLKNHLNNSQKNWDGLAKTDPFWAILTEQEKKGGKWNKNDFFATGVKEIEYLMTHLNQKEIQFSKLRALDFGCGVGRLTQPLSKYFNKVIGIDISPQMITLAENYNSKPNCQFVLNPTADIKLFHDNSFDFIYSNIVLQHITPDKVFDYLLEFIRILRNDGLLIFQLPDRFINPYVDVLRNNCFSQKYLYRLYLFAKFGFKPVIETYCIKKNKIIDFLNINGVSILRMEENRNAGPKWISYTYYVRKSR